MKCAQDKVRPAPLLGGKKNVLAPSLPPSRPPFAAKLYSPVESLGLDLFTALALGAPKQPTERPSDRIPVNRAVRTSHRILEGLISSFSTCPSSRIAEKSCRLEEYGRIVKRGGASGWKDSRGASHLEGKLEFDGGEMMGAAE